MRHFTAVHRDGDNRRLNKLCDSRAECEDLIAQQDDPENWYVQEIYLKKEDTQ